MPGPHGELQSGSSLAPEKTKPLDGPASNEESVTNSLVANFASDRVEGSNNSDGELASDPEVEVLRVESEPLQVEPAGPKSEASVPRRTALPNSRVKRSPPPPTSKTPATLTYKPFRVVKRGCKWSEEEDALLLRLRYQGLIWEDIAAELPGRSKVACKMHYQQSLAPSLTPAKSAYAPEKMPIGKRTGAGAGRSRERWSAEELKELNKWRNAGTEWHEIADRLPGRTAAACRRKMAELHQPPKPSVSRTSRAEKGRLEAMHDGGHAGDSNDDEKMAESENREEMPKRNPIEETYPDNSDDEMHEVDVKNQESENKNGDGSLGSAIEVENATIVSDEDMSDSAGEDDPSNSDTEDEAEKKRKHALFFLKR